MFSVALELLLKFLVMSFQIKDSNAILMLVLLVAAGAMSLCSSVDTAENGEDYVREACSVTRYNDICIHFLASYSNIAKRDPSKWARAGVSVTIGEAKHVAEYLVKMKNSSATLKLKGRNQAALSDCIELFGDTLNNLHSSLGVLRKLSGQTFDSQVADITTWVSAALTDEDSCLEGFSSSSSRKRFKLLRDAVIHVTYMTSNALALVNKLATAGPECLIHP